MVSQAAASALPLGIPALGPHLRDRMDLSLVALGALLAAPTAGLALTTFAWGSLADRVGERRVLTWGLGLSALALLLVASSTRSPLLAGVFLVGAGAAGASAPAASGRAVVAWFPVHERGLALSLRHTSPMVGGAIGAAVLTMAASLGGTATAFCALAVLAAIGAAAGRGVVPPSGGAEARRAATTAPHPAGDGLVWLLAAAGAAVIVVQAAVLRFMSAYLHDGRGWSEGAAAATLSATLLTAAAFRIVAGVVSDRRGRRIAVLRDQALVAGVLLLPVGLATGLPALLAAALLVTATALSMAGNGVAYAAVAEVSPRRTGAALGVYATVLIVIVTVTPPVFGAAVTDDTLGAAFGVLGVFPLFGAALLVAAERVWRARRRGAAGTLRP